MTTIIKTNGHLRDIVYGYELDASERESWHSDDTMFVRYHGELECVSEFMRIDPSDNELSQWDGVMGTSYHTGTLVRFVDIDGKRSCSPEYAVMGTVQYTSA